MIEIFTHAREKSSLTLRIEFHDEEGELTIPTEAQWTLSDTAGTNINTAARTYPVSVAAPLASTFYVVLSGDDLEVTTAEQAASTEPVERVFTLEAKYANAYTDAEVPWREEYRFWIDQTVKDSALT